jgi:uridine kinase
MLPLFSITGPSGAGKSTVCRGLPRLLPQCVPLDGEVLWQDDFCTTHTEPARTAADVAEWVRARLCERL